jgi:hypothetical protein
MALSKAAILSADDKRSITVDVPEWGGDVVLRVMTGSERDKFESEFVGDKKNVADVRAKLVAKCLVDDRGDRLFTDAEVAELGTKSAAVLDRLFRECMKLNRFSKDDVDELAGNS